MFYRKLKRQFAGQTLFKYLFRFCAQYYLKRRARNLPSESPVCTDWLPVPFHTRFSQADGTIREIFHKWRCRKYRQNIDQQEYFRLREKLTASVLLRGRKTAYETTVSHPFRGDYVKIRQNTKWRKVASDTNDEYVVFADVVNKVNRSSGKVSASLLVISTAGIAILDPRSLQLRYRVPVICLQRVSVSPFCDTVGVLHLKEASLSKNKGDFILECRHIVEMVAKLYLVVQNLTGAPLSVFVSSNISVESDDDEVELVFRPLSDEDSGVFSPGCFLSGGAHHVPKPPTAMDGVVTNEVDEQQQQGISKLLANSPLFRCYDNIEFLEDISSHSKTSELPPSKDVNIRYSRKGARLEVYF